MSQSPTEIPINATMEKFGWPGTAIHVGEHWVVALRPEQPTAGSVVVICRQPVQSFGAVDAAGMTELGEIVSQTEAMLRRAVDYAKINWMMLMMVDPDVHFHVIPRYDGQRSLAGVTVGDAGWPGPPALGTVERPDPSQQAAMIAALRDAWEAA